MQKRIRCVIMRGGTSRGLFFHREDLPEDEREWEKLLFTALGAPDPKQVDGLGGGTSSTSKAVVVNKSKLPGIDVDYTFIQVGVDRKIADMAGNCGNLSAAVGPFAIDEGLVPAAAPHTVVNIFNTNTGKRLRSRVKVRNGRFDPSGDCAIPGLAQKGSEIVMDYYDPGGALTGKLLPSGRVVDMVRVGQAEYPVTIVDCTNPYIFVRAKDLGMTGGEPAAQIDSSPQLRVLQMIRDLAAKMIGLTGEAFPKICMVAEAHACRTEADGADLAARTISMGKTHKTIPLTGAFSLAAAAALPGSVPANLIRKQLPSSGSMVLKISHPGGVIAVALETSETANGLVGIEKVTAARTARRIMDGYIYV